MAYTTFQPKDYFNTKLYTGDGNATNAITGVGFQPDWVWIKNRGTTARHVLFDAVRGSQKALFSHLTDAEQSTNQYGTLNSFDSDGFTVADGSSSGERTNNSSENYVSWNWKAGGSGSSNTDGVISATVSADASRGFSIIKYTGSGSASTVGHGLGAAPDITIRKKINATGDWFVHTTLIDGSFDFLKLNTTDAKSNSSLTGFTSTTVGVDNDTSQEIIYAFKSIKGFSKFGRFTGTGSSNGPFIYTGFKPAFIITRRTSGATGDWQLYDNKRTPFNVADTILFPNGNTADSQADGYAMDILSNGFKIRTDNSNKNNSGSKYIFMAFAEMPFVGSNDTPATAR